MNIKKILAGAGATAILLGNVVVPAFATLIGTNGSFESSDVVGNFNTVNAGETTITDWTVVSGSVDHIDDYWQPATGDQSIDLNGLAAGTISQTFNTTIGATYNVEFWMSGNPDSASEGPNVSPSNKLMTVTANSLNAQQFSFNTATKGNTKENMMWEKNTYSFVANNTSTVLKFASDTAGAFGPALDDVVIEETLPTPTPTGPEIPEQCDQETEYNVIEGTEGSEVLTGTNGPDLILAKGGSDVVNGNNGNDCIVGGAGSDLLHGNNGHDVILGGEGSDAINGQNGNDDLYGEAGSDSLKGGSGNDDLWGGTESDYLKGEAGNDTANGGTESDSCNAEAEDASCEA